MFQVFIFLLYSEWYKDYASRFVDIDLLQQQIDDTIHKYDENKTLVSIGMLIIAHA